MKDKKVKTLKDLEKRIKDMPESDVKSKILEDIKKKTQHETIRK